MNPKGIVRQVDDLGRVVIPKEVRKSLRIDAGTHVELILTDTGFFVKRYSELQPFIDDVDLYCNALSQITKHGCVICDMDGVISSSSNSKVPDGAAISVRLQKLLEGRIKPYVQTTDALSQGVEHVLWITDDACIPVGLVYPIVVESKTVGAVVILDNVESSIDLCTVSAKTLAKLIEYMIRRHKSIP